MSRRLRATALAAAAATGLVPLAATSADAAPAPAPKEHTKLPVCESTAPVQGGASPQFFGVKVAVGFFHVKSDGIHATQVRHGQRVHLEYRVEDTTNQCVIEGEGLFEVRVYRLLADGVTREYVETIPMTWEPKEKHLSGYWTVPDHLGGGRDQGEGFVVNVGDVDALFHVR